MLYKSERHTRRLSPAKERFFSFLTVFSVVVVIVHVFYPFLSDIRWRLGSTTKIPRISLPPSFECGFFYVAVTWLSTRLGGEVSRARVRNADVRAACAKSLGLMDDLRALPILAKYSHDDHNAVSFEARRGIQKLLLALHRKESFRLDSQTSRDLARLLPLAGSAAEAANILRALIQSGSPAALPEVEQYMRSAYTEETTLLTATLVAMLRERAIDDKERSTLLRPASSEEDSLLRPAYAAQDADPMQLLRPTKHADP